MSNQSDSGEARSRLRIPELDELPGDLAAIVASAPDPVGMRAFALLPQHFLAYLQFAGCVMADEPTLLTVAERELVAVIVSAENRCPSCLVTHTRGLARLWGDQLRAQRTAVNHRSVALPPRQRALADFAEKLTRTPATVSTDDIDALRRVGLTDEEIASAVETIALYNFTNRIASALGLVPAADPDG